MGANWSASADPAHVCSRRCLVAHIAVIGAGIPEPASGMDTAIIPRDLDVARRSMDGFTTDDAEHATARWARTQSRGVLQHGPRPFGLDLVSSNCLHGG